MKWKPWLYGLGAAVIGGGATSGSAWLGMAGARAAGLDVPSLNFKALGVILLSGGLSSLFFYLKQSPLPKDDDLQSPDNAQARHDATLATLQTAPGSEKLDGHGSAD